MTKIPRFTSWEAYWRVRNGLAELKGALIELPSSNTFADYLFEKVQAAEAQVVNAQPFRIRPPWEGR